MAAKDADLARDFSLDFVFVSNDDFAAFEVSLETTPKQVDAGATTTGDRTEELVLVGDLGTVLEAELIVSAQQEVVGAVYRMRGYDSTEARTVYWDSDTVDATGVNYSGPGPLLNVVVSIVIC